MITTIFPDGCIEVVSYGCLEREAIIAEKTSGLTVLEGFSTYGERACSAYYNAECERALEHFNLDASAHYAICAGAAPFLFGPVVIVQ